MEKNLLRLEFTWAEDSTWFTGSKCINLLPQGRRKPTLFGREQAAKTAAKEELSAMNKNQFVGHVLDWAKYVKAPDQTTSSGP